jgi:hypothetical protein
VPSVGWLEYGTQSAHRSGQGRGCRRAAVGGRAPVDSYWAQSQEQRAMTQPRRWNTRRIALYGALCGVAYSFIRGLAVQDPGETQSYWGDLGWSDRRRHPVRSCVGRSQLDTQSSVGSGRSNGAESYSHRRVRPAHVGQCTALLRRVGRRTIRSRGGPIGVSNGSHLSYRRPIHWQIYLLSGPASAKKCQACSSIAFHSVIWMNVSDELGLFVQWTRGRHLS